MQSLGQEARYWATRLISFLFNLLLARSLSSLQDKNNANKHWTNAAAFN